MEETVGKGRPSIVLHSKENGGLNKGRTVLIAREVTLGIRNKWLVRWAGREENRSNECLTYSKPTRSALKSPV